MFETALLACSIVVELGCRPSLVGRPLLERWTSLGGVDSSSDLRGVVLGSPSLHGLGIHLSPCKVYGRRCPLLPSVQHQYLLCILLKDWLLFFLFFRGWFR